MACSTFSIISGAREFAAIAVDSETAIVALEIGVALVTVGCVIVEVSDGLGAQPIKNNVNSKLKNVALFIIQSCFHLVNVRKV